jgi:hypothetical protein
VPWYLAHWMQNRLKFCINTPHFRLNTGVLVSIQVHQCFGKRLSGRAFSNLEPGDSNSAARPGLV